AIVIAGTNRGPMIIDDRDLAMQLRLAILDYSYTGLQQMRIVGTCNQILKTVLANAQQQRHINAAPGSNSQALAHLATGCKIRIGQQGGLTRITQGMQIGLLYG